MGATILGMFNQNNWFNPSQPIYTIGFILYAVLNVFFAYFYTSITFNPIEVADNMKKQGGFIPGIRPGKPTQDYLNKILNNLIFIGVCGLLIVVTIRFSLMVCLGHMYPLAVPPSSLLWALSWKP